MEFNILVNEITTSGTGFSSSSGSIDKMPTKLFDKPIKRVLPKIKKKKNTIPKKKKT